MQAEYRRKKLMPLERRFWAKVEKGQECWVWTGSTDAWGYGKINRGRQGEGNIKAHRLSWQIHFGDPGSLFVLHRCDNPPCVNPEHLFLGTAKDNAADMAAKGRHFRHRQTRCKRGHEFTPENTRVESSGSRRCLACERLNGAKKRERFRELVGDAAGK